MVRQSFAAYYYTREPPPAWDGASHSTVFRARPDEKLRGLVQMPGERLMRTVTETVRRSKSRIKTWIGRD
jgi:hypothetical protein